MPQATVKLGQRPATNLDLLSWLANPPPTCKDLPSNIRRIKSPPKDIARTFHSSSDITPHIDSSGHSELATVCMAVAWGFTHCTQCTWALLKAELTFQLATTHRAACSSPSPASGMPNTHFDSRTTWYRKSHTSPGSHYSQPGLGILVGLEAPIQRGCCWTLL